MMSRHERIRRVVRWTGSVAGRGQIALVVAVEPVDASRAMVEAWLELPDRRQTLLEPQPASCAIASDGRMLHIDVHVDGEPVLAMSTDVSADRLLYASSSLMRTSGLAVGALDPPSAETVERDLASA